MLFFRVLETFLYYNLITELCIHQTLCMCNVNYETMCVLFCASALRLKLFCIEIRFVLHI